MPNEWWKLENLIRAKRSDVGREGSRVIQVRLIFGRIGGLAASFDAHGPLAEAMAKHLDALEAKHGRA